MKNKEVINFLNKLGISTRNTYEGNIAFNLKIKDSMSHQIDLEFNKDFSQKQIVDILLYQAYKVGRADKAGEILRQLDGRQP